MHNQIKNGHGEDTLDERKADTRFESTFILELNILIVGDQQNKEGENQRTGTEEMQITKNKCD